MKHLYRLCIVGALSIAPTAFADPYPGTAPLTWDGDFAERMVDSIDALLMRELDASIEARAAHWRRDTSSPEAYEASIAKNRSRLAHILGVRDERRPVHDLELIATTSTDARLGSGDAFEILAVRWPVIGDIHAEGLLLRPVDREPVADVVALPRCDQRLEHVAGLSGDLPDDLQFARRLAESGCRVVVPVLINRADRIPRLTNREWLYRPAFVLGRHLIGYEVQKVLACIDWFALDSGDDSRPIGVIGEGDGGMIALYAGALDPRIDAVCVSGYFQSRQTIWQQPIDRNVFGLLEQFGDAELASMVAPRPLVVEYAPVPEKTWQGGRGAPAETKTPPEDEVVREAERARALVGELDKAGSWLTVCRRSHTSNEPGMTQALGAFLGGLDGDLALAPAGPPPRRTMWEVDVTARHDRQVYEIDRHNQRLRRESPQVRDAFMSRLYKTTGSIKTYRHLARQYRKQFGQEIIGSFSNRLEPPNPRTRKAYDNERWTGWEVVLDVFDGVFAYGILLVPKDMQPHEKRPVIVCQHGLDGRPQDVIEGDMAAYRNFAARLADEGFVVFAPQNPYILRDRFRVLQRKANPLGKTLFSIIVPQHEQITQWLASLPIVDGDRIAFYGLSYGGKAAMRIPALVERYCLSICSGDFNDWIWKTTSSTSPYSYVDRSEYEIFEFDLGSTFSYAEMAALIAPRPFMVERGHLDKAAPDERVAFEFAKVRHLYAAELGVGDRCRIEWFVGPHTINGQGTFEFLHEQLEWPPADSPP